MKSGNIFNTGLFHGKPKRGRGELIGNNVASFREETLQGSVSVLQSFFRERVS